MGFFGSKKKSGKSSGGAPFSLGLKKKHRTSHTVAPLKRKEEEEEEEEDEVFEYTDGNNQQEELEACAMDGYSVMDHHQQPQQPRRKSSALKPPATASSTRKSTATAPASSLKKDADQLPAAKDPTDSNDNDNSDNSDNSDNNNNDDASNQTRDLIKKFVADIWNRGDIDLIPEVCSSRLRFNGQGGMDKVGHEGFARMVATIHDALSEYHCEIHSMVVEGNKAFCRLRFSGRHTGDLLGFQPSHRLISWMGATEFTIGPDARILKVWELGDMKSLEQQLQQQQL